MRVDTTRRRDRERAPCESMRRACAYVGRAGMNGGRAGSEINVFVLRPPSCAPGKDSVSRKGLMARRMAETTGVESRVEYQPVIAFACKGPTHPLPPSSVSSCLFHQRTPPCRAPAFRYRSPWMTHKIYCLCISFYVSFPFSLFTVTRSVTR